jgi:hypothetical protein
MHMRESFFGTEQRYCYGVSMGLNGREMHRIMQGISADH